MAGDDDQDLLDRAADLLRDTLEPGQCCDPALRGLRFQIISLLSCEACQDMLFMVDNLRISGSMYRAVANALRDPGHRLHLAYQAPASATKGSEFDASYNSSSNRLTFPFAAIGGKTADQAFQCQTIIHECTHAALDIAQTRMTRLGNEVAAWIAGTLFLRGQGLPFDDSIPFRENLSAVAESARKANVRKRMYVVPPEAIAALKQDIATAYHIAKDFDDTGDGLRD